jgi:hypothetical protein
MEKVEIEPSLRTSVRKDVPKEVHEDFMDTLGKESPPYSFVQKDDGRPWRLKEATNDEVAAAVHDLVMCNRRRDLRSITREVSISFDSVRAILTDFYGMSKFAA